MPHETSTPQSRSPTRLGARQRFQREKPSERPIRRIMEELRKSRLFGTVRRREVRDIRRRRDVT